MSNQAIWLAISFACLALAGSVDAAAIKPVRPERIVLASNLIARVVAADKRTIAADRAKLRSLMGKSGCHRQRRLLLQQVRHARIEIRLSGQVPPLPLRFRRIDDRPAHDALPAHAIGYLDTIKVFQILTPKSALCKIGRYETPAQADAQARALDALSILGGQVGVPSPWFPVLAKITGVDFSSCHNGSVLDAKSCLMRTDGFKVYPTANRATNTAEILYPIKVVDDRKKAKSHK